MDGRFSIPFAGKSMWPFLRPGDILDIAIQTMPRRGDIFLFWQKDELVVHRAVCRNGKICFKGDKSLCYDDFVHIVGRVVGFKRDDYEFFWGEKMVPLGRIMAWISVRTNKKRVYRLVGLSLMAGLEFFLFRYMLIFCRSHRRS